MEFDFTKEPGRTICKDFIREPVEPLISIITPWYNAETYFEQTFNCVINQTFPWFEWIIVDDGSTSSDGVKLLKSFVNKDSRVKLIHKANGGIASARNMGIQEAITDLIVPLDADDLIMPTYLELNYWSLYSNPDASWSYTDCVGFKGQEYLWRKKFSSETMKTDNLLTCTAMIRKADLEGIGCYAEIEKHYNEDWFAWLKLLAKGKFPVHVNEYSFWYRRSDSGVLSIVKGNEKIKEKALKVIQNAAEFIKEDVYAVEFPRSEKANTFVSPHCSTWPLYLPDTDKKKNILLLIPWMDMGGADLFNLEFTKKLDKTKYKISILTTNFGENAWQQRFQEYTQDIFNLPSFVKLEDYPEFISYFIKSRQINLIMITNSYLGYYLVPWLRKEFPNVILVDYVHMEEWYWRNGGYARTSGIMGDVLEKTYVCNEKTRHVLIDNFDRDAQKVKTVYIGVDKEFYDADCVKKDTIRTLYNIPEQKHIILFPCRLHPQKRPFLMLEIARKLSKNNFPAAFVIVGDGVQMEEMTRYVEEFHLENCVFFAGRQKDLRPFYKDAEVTLICSLKEGLSLTAYESLAMGTPVITSDVGGQGELVNETVGRVIPLLQNEGNDFDCRNFSKQEIELYTTAITDILSDNKEYSKMCHTCRQRIESNFSTDVMISVLEKEFETLLNKDSMENRLRLSNDLNEVSSVADDYFTLFLEYEKAKQEQEEVWTSREWFRSLYEKEQKKAAELDRIHSMRTWKVMQKYIFFMDTNALGKCFARVRDFIFR